MRCWYQTLRSSTGTTSSISNASPKNHANSVVFHVDRPAYDMKIQYLAKKRIYAVLKSEMMVLQYKLCKTIRCNLPVAAWTSATRRINKDSAKALRRSI